MADEREKPGHVTRARHMRQGVAAACAVAVIALAGCGGSAAEPTDGGVRVVVTYAPPTATSPPRSLTQPATLATVSPIAFPTNAGTITNVGSTQLMAGSKARVKDSADGLSLRETPSIKAKALDSLPAGTQLNILADPADAEGRTWVKVAYGTKQGYVAAEFVERIA